MLLHGLAGRARGPPLREQARAVGGYEGRTGARGRSPTPASLRPLPAAGSRPPLAAPPGRGGGHRGRQTDHHGVARARAHLLQQTQPARAPGRSSTSRAALARLRSAAVSPRAFSSDASPSCRAFTTCEKMRLSSAREHDVLDFYRQQPHAQRLRAGGSQFLHACADFRPPFQQLVHLQAADHAAQRQLQLQIERALVVLHAVDRHQRVDDFISRRQAEPQRQPVRAEHFLTAERGEARPHVHLGHGRCVGGDPVLARAEQPRRAPARVAQAPLELVHRHPPRQPVRGPQQQEQQ